MVVLLGFSGGEGDIEEYQTKHRVDGPLLGKSLVHTYCTIHIHLALSSTGRLGRKYSTMS